MNQQIPERAQAILDAIRAADRAAKDKGYTDSGELWEVMQAIRADALAIKRACRMPAPERQPQQSALSLD